MLKKDQGVEYGYISSNAYIEYIQCRAVVSGGAGGTQSYVIKSAP